VINLMYRLDHDDSTYANRSMVFDVKVYAVTNFNIPPSLAMLAHDEYKTAASEF
jgi:hypothetical protein